MKVIKFLRKVLETVEDADLNVPMSTIHPWGPGNLIWLCMSNAEFARHTNLELYLSKDQVRYIPLYRGLTGWMAIRQAMGLHPLHYGLAGLEQYLFNPRAYDVPTLRSQYERVALVVNILETHDYSAFPHNLQVNLTGADRLLGAEMAKILIAGAVADIEDRLSAGE